MHGNDKSLSDKRLNLLDFMNTYNELAGYHRNVRTDLEAAVFRTWFRFRAHYDQLPASAKHRLAQM